MEQEELTILNIGESLDNLMNLDQGDMVFAEFYTRQQESILKSL